MIKKITIYVILPLCLAVAAISIYLAFFGNAKSDGTQKNNEPVAETNIKVSVPKSGDEVGLPLTISGEARVFENQFNYELKDGNGKFLSSGSLYANSPDVGQFGAFNKEIFYEEPETDSGILEVFDYSAKDGTKENIVAVQLKFKKIETTAVKVFFGNSKLDPEAMDCRKVYAVNRRIPKIPEVGKAAMERLLEGPTAAEKEEGYFTSLNQGITIQKLTIENKVAKIDFDEALETGIGGSCKVAFIRSQITNTLKQFPSVSEVIISIDGRTEDILQP